MTRAQDASVEQMLGDVTALANGSESDKLRVVEMLNTQPHLFTYASAANMVERLCMETEPESVRVALAKSLENSSIAAGIYGIILDRFSKDPSDVVREQRRLSRAKAEGEIAWPDEGRIVKSRLGSVRFAKDWMKKQVRFAPKWIRSWIKAQRLRLSVVVSTGIFLITTYEAVNFGWKPRNGSMETLTQINATIFALAFTIPLAASQFSKYHARPESFFDRTNLLYFLTYAVSIFYPIFVRNSSFEASIAVGLSAMCTCLLIPFLFRTSEKLTPKSIIQHEYRKVLAEWGDGTREALQEYGASLENIARSALESKDYSTFQLTVQSIVNLIRESMDLPARSSHQPLQPGAAGVRQVAIRIGEASLEDRFAIAIWCSALLGLATRRASVIDKTGATMKFVEYQHLQELLNLAGARPDSQRPLVLSFIEWAILNEYSNPEDEEKNISFCAGSLSGLSPDMVDETFRNSSQRIQDSFWASYTDPVRPFLYSYHPLVRSHLETRLSRLEARVSEYVINRKVAALNSKSKLQILKAGPEDALDVVMLQKLSYLPEVKARQDWRIVEMTETASDARAAMSESIILKAVMDGIMFGSVRGKIDADRFRIKRLFVHPAFRKRGIGSQLLTEIESMLSGTERRSAFEAYIGLEEPSKIAFVQKRGYSISRQFPLTNRATLTYVEKPAAGQDSARLVKTETT